MIPKLIHLFWFGGNEKSALINRCIESWRIFAPEYRIVKWNEDNFDVNFCRRSRQAYEARKYAFVADIARLKVLYEQGGVYLDTDVELTAPLDELIFQTRGAKAYFLFLNERFIGTGAGFGAEAGCQVVKATPRNDMKKPHHLPISANCGGGSAYFRCMGKLNQAGKQRLSARIRFASANNIFNFAVCFRRPRYRVFRYRNRPFTTPKTCSTFARTDDFSCSLRFN